MVYNIRPLEEFENLSEKVIKRVSSKEWNEIFQTAVANNHIDVLPFIMINSNECIDFNAAIEVAVEEDVYRCYEYLLELIDVETEKDRERNAKTLISVLNAGWDEDLDFWLCHSNLEAVLNLLENNDVLCDEELSCFKDVIKMCQSEEQKDTILSSIDHNGQATHRKKM